MIAAKQTVKVLQNNKYIAKTQEKTSLYSLLRSLHQSSARYRQKQLRNYVHTLYLIEVKKETALSRRTLLMRPAVLYV